MMRIGIIGVGEMGGTLVQQFTKIGHEVKIANASNIEKLKDLALKTGAKAVTLSEVTVGVDAIVLAIPLINILQLPEGLFKNVSLNTPIIDTSNYYPIRDGAIDEIERGLPESVWVSGKVNRSVIKAYNSILYRSLNYSGLPANNKSRIALPVSGDDSKQKEVVATLINDSGFDVFDNGDLNNSWRQQPGSPVYCTDLTLLQLQNSISQAEKAILPERRELGLKYIMTHDPELWRENVSHNRIIYESVF